MTGGKKLGSSRAPEVLVRRWIRVPARRLTPAMQARLIATRERQAQALELRKAGLTYQEIADALKFSNASGASRAVRSAIDRLGLEAAKDVVVMDLARLDEYMKRCTAQLRQHNDLSQIDRLLRIMDKKHQILGITTDTFREEQAKQANSSVTNNAIMVVQGGQSDFVKEMMRAVGMNVNSPEAIAYLQSLPAEENSTPALPPGSTEPAPSGKTHDITSDSAAHKGGYDPKVLVGEILESRTVEDAMAVQAMMHNRIVKVSEPIRDGIDAPESVPEIPQIYVQDIETGHIQKNEGGGEGAGAEWRPV